MFLHPFNIPLVFPVTSLKLLLLLPELIFANCSHSFSTKQLKILSLKVPSICVYGYMFLDTLNSFVRLVSVEVVPPPTTALPSSSHRTTAPSQCPKQNPIVSERTQTLYLDTSNTTPFQITNFSLFPFDFPDPSPRVVMW